MFELLAHRKLSNLMFFGIVFLDALGAIFPEYLNRKVTMFVPFPILFVLYLLNAEKANKLFLLALGLNFFGVCNFNNPYGQYNSVGLVYHGIAYIMYSVILLRGLKAVGRLKMLILAAVLLLLVVIPVRFLYYEGIKDTFVFWETLIYIVSGSLYMLLAILTYLVYKTQIARFLLFSAMSILLSAYFQGYNLFIDKNDLLNFFAVIGFNLAHYFLCCYLVLSKSRKK